MFSYSSRGWVNIQNGTANGRSLSDSLTKGRITITGTDHKGREYQRVVVVTDGEILDNSLRRAGKVVSRIVYGKFETVQTPHGREVTRFAKGSGRGKHGKSIRFASLFKVKGVVHSWFKQGRLVRQKFIYRTGRLAYDWKGRAKVCVIRDARGRELYQVNGNIDGREMWSGISVFDAPMANWFLQGAPFKVVKVTASGTKEWFSGAYVRGQKQGRWVESGKVTFYEHGVAIPARLFKTPADQLNPAELLKLENAQLRMALLSKITPARLAKVGKLIHQQGKMRLIDVPGMEVRILKVVCPSTQAVYHIKVPKDATKCEDARQWTFHVDAGIRVKGRKIKFTQET